MGIIDKDSTPGLFAERMGSMIAENLRYRDLLARVLERMPGMGNSELMVEIRDALAEGHQ